MSAPLNYHPPSTATHYTPAQLHLPGYLLSLLAATSLAVAGGFLYIYARSRIDGYPYHVAASVVAAMAVGVLTVCVSYFGKVRARTPAILAALLISLPAVYAMWIAWFHAIFGQANLTYAALITHPGDLLRLAYRINQLGTWTFNDRRITGIPLALIWLLEAGMPVAAALFCALHSLHDEAPRCHGCNKPCTSVPDLPRFAADRQSDFLLAVENRDFAALATHAPPEPGHVPELVLRLYSCPHCLATHFLTVTRFDWPVNSQGVSVFQATPLIRQLRITPDEALLLGSTCQQILNTRTTVA